MDDKTIENDKSNYFIIGMVVVIFILKMVEVILK